MKKFLAGLMIFLAGAACAVILTHGSSQAQSDESVMAKLNEITKSQQEVAAAINALKEDIQIIKIRVTQIQ